MEEKYRNFFIREINEPESWVAYFYACPIERFKPVFKSPMWFTDEEQEHIDRNRSKCLDYIKKMIDKYHEEIAEYQEYHGYMIIKVPFNEIAKSLDDAASLAKNYAEERLIAAVELIDYQEEKTSG